MNPFEPLSFAKADGAIKSVSQAAKMRHIGTIGTVYCAMPIAINMRKYLQLNVLCIICLGGTAAA